MPPSSGQQPRPSFNIFTPLPLFALATLLRVILLLYGLAQDAFSPMKYTDIDYFVFTDASRFLSLSPPQSPYSRETYRYTPLLAWLLYPTTFRPQWFWFSFGKVLFAVSDLVAGWLIYVVLRGGAADDGGVGKRKKIGGGGSAIGEKGVEVALGKERALKFASIWLLNPMVATISTRGSSEGLLGVMVVALLWAVTRKKFATAGVLLGLSVHFKIYPFIYAPSLIWWMDEENLGLRRSKGKGNESDGNGVVDVVKRFCNGPRITLTFTSLVTFVGLNILMYSIYGPPFLQHTYLHHITRIDHRHNFSPYNTLLYLTSSPSSTPPSTIHLESLAFLPQLLLSTVLLPFFLAKKSLPSTLLAQTFCFVTFNKVCTSQYFLWYLIFLPFYLPSSSLLSSPRLGLSVLVAWVGMQVLWLQQGFELEFNGRSTFVPGLWVGGVGFFLVNCWILGIIVADVGITGRRWEGDGKGIETALAGQKDVVVEKGDGLKKQVKNR